MTKTPMKCKEKSAGVYWSFFVALCINNKRLQKLAQSITYEGFQNMLDE